MDLCFKIITDYLKKIRRLEVNKGGIKIEKVNLTPIAVWLSVLFPVIQNIININFSNYTAVIHEIMVFILILLSLVNLYRNHKIPVVKNRLYFFVSIFLALLFLSFMSVFTANNIYYFHRMRYYLLPLLFIIYFLTDQKSIFNFDNKSYKKIQYNIPILLFVFINIIGCYLIFTHNSMYIKLTQGPYADIQRYYRFGFYQFSGVFAWPNLLAYASAGLFLLCRITPVNFLIRLTLLIPIFLSVNRSVILGILFIIIVENKKEILKKAHMLILPFILISVFVAIKNLDYIINVMKKTFNEFFGLSDTLSFRNIMLHKSFELFKEHIWLGIGIRRITDLSASISDKDTLILNNFGQIEHTSDTFYVIFAEIGLLGILLLIMALLKILTDTSSNMKILILFALLYSYSLSNPFTAFPMEIVNLLFFAHYLKVNDEGVKNHRIRTKY